MEYRCMRRICGLLLMSYILCMLLVLSACTVTPDREIDSDLLILGTMPTPLTTPTTTPAANPETIDETMAETVPGAIPETAPENQPETVPETIFETMPEPNLETITETEPETVPETEPTTETIPEAVPETASETMPETMIETTAETTLETITETSPETAPESISETSMETVPETENVFLPFVPTEPVSMGDWKAMWLSQFDLAPLYNNGTTQREETDFRTRLAVVLDNVAGEGYNTVVVQVRPNADSIYPSEIYPPSRYAVGTYGGEFLYDPFAIVVEMAEARGLAVHAWINPMRGMTEAEMQQIDPHYLVRQWYDRMVASESEGRIVRGERYLYLDPAFSDVRTLIAAGVAEILQNYDVAGVHMDDYFYPTTDESFDRISYTAYRDGGGELTLLDWRRANLDTLVATLYATVKAEKPTALFGISPAGNIKTVYESHCADVYKWCSTPGYVDYICPQLYFGFEHATCDFVNMCTVWSDIVTTDYVHLLIGLTFGKAVSGVDEYAGASGRDEWLEHKDILMRELLHTTTVEHCVGVTVFCYQHLFDLNTGAILEASRTEHESFAALLPTVTWHPEVEGEQPPESDGEPENNSDSQLQNKTETISERS